MKQAPEASAVEEDKRERAMTPTRMFPLSDAVRRAGIPIAARLPGLRA